MDLLLVAVVGALATAVIGPLMVASAEVRRHNRQVAERDEDLEEWIVVRDRKLHQRYHEIEQQANAQGVLGGGTLAAGRAATQTILLYEYREEVRQARAFVLRVAVDERWSHRLMRRLLGAPFPSLTTPDRAERLVEFWLEGTDRTQLTWSLQDILSGLPVRQPSRTTAV